MTHFGIICLEATGHLNTMFPLGHELQRRGHNITVFSTSGAKSKTLSAGFGFQVIGEEKFSVIDAQGEKLSGLAALRFSINRFKEKAAISLRDTPQVVKERGIEAVLVDMSVLEGSTIADFLDLPFVTVCCVLPFYQESSVPPVATIWKYNPAWWAPLRNRTAYSLFNLLSRPILLVISEYRKKWGLPAYSKNNDVFSKLAIITRHIREFEFPNRQLPPYFHFTGPFHHSQERPSVNFPFDKLNDLPLIYASLGTLVNDFEYVFGYIAEACVDLNAQLVISLGGGLDVAALPNLAGEPLVVKYAPQLELLKKATLTITHAGLNTTLESLSCGVPMVAIPIAFDQPGVAARIAWTGAGEFIPLSSLSVSKLRETIKRVLNEKSYKQNALRLQKAIGAYSGVSRAADIIEQAVSTRKPVIN